MKFLSKLILCSFILYLLAIPTGQLLRMQMPYNIALTLSDVLLGITVILWLAKCIWKKELIQQNHYARYIGVFLLVALVSLIVNMQQLTAIQFLVSLLYLIRWAGYVSLYFITVSLQTTEKRMIHRLLLFIGSTVVLLGVIQYLWYQNLRNLYYLGWDDHLYRLFSSFLDPNFTGVFLALFFVYLIFRILIATQKKEKIALLLLGVTTFTSIILTYSRSAFISLIIVSLWFLIWKKLYKLLVGVIIGCLVLFLMLSRGFSKENTNLLRTASTFARVESLQHAVIIFIKNPVLGVGFNAYRYAQVRYGFRKDTTFSPNHADAGTDNSFLFVAGTTGIIGLLSYFLLLRCIVMDTWREQYEREKKISFFATCVFISLMILFISSLFINALFYPSLMAWMWVLLGLRERT